MECAIFIMLRWTQQKSQFLSIVVTALVLLRLCYHENEINKLLHSNRHLPNITHVGGSHKFYINREGKFLKLKDCTNFYNT
jgi:hypothetical protein